MLHLFFTKDAHGEYSDELKEAAWALAHDVAPPDQPDELQCWLTVAANTHIPPDHHYLQEDLSPYAHYAMAGVSVSYYTCDTLTDGACGVELYLSTELSRLVVDVPLTSDQFMRVDVYAAGPSRRTVVTEESLLTPAEIKQHQKEVNAAILEELKTGKIQHVSTGPTQERPQHSDITLRCQVEAERGQSRNVD